MNEAAYRTMTARSARNVVQELLDEMDRIVRDYHPEVGRTGRNFDDLIQGTAFFPGGSGLWRGDRNGGALPEGFPEAPVMVVAHNFAGIGAHDRLCLKGGEVQSYFWRDVLIPILAEAGIGPERCFFTNALMGLKPGNSMGDMPRCDGHEAQCEAFLKRQIEIVRPSAIVGLGGKAQVRLRKINEKSACIKHPSAWQFRPRRTRAERAVEQGRRLVEFIHD